MVNPLIAMETVKVVSETIGSFIKDAGETERTQIKDDGETGRAFHQSKAQVDITKITTIGQTFATVANSAAVGVSGLAEGIGTAVNGLSQGAGEVTKATATTLCKLSELLSAPLDVICNWTGEPLQYFEYVRQENSKDNDVQREIELQAKLSEQKIKEDESSTNLQIKRETEIIRIITEIEILKKDKEFERMKLVSDAMMEYQTELTRINVEAVDAIGSMRIDLQRKAYELIHEKTLQYKKLQSEAIEEAEEQLARIDNNPNMRESSKTILSNAVEESLVGTVKEAKRFIVQLNDDMQLISKDINLITTSGQNFIQRHLEQFQLIGMSGETTALLENSSERLVGFEK